MTDKSDFIFRREDPSNGDYNPPKTTKAPPTSRIAIAAAAFSVSWAFIPYGSGLIRGPIPFWLLVAFSIVSVGGPSVGIVLGIIALKQIRSSKGTLGGRYLAITGIIAACLFYIGLGILMPMVRSSHRYARMTQCRSNLRQIGLAMMMYANDNKGWTPSIEPGAIEIANSAGVPVGCVLTFKDTDSKWKTSGLGRLWEGGYLKKWDSWVFYNPEFRVNEEVLRNAFRCDDDEPFWTSLQPGAPDGDGKGELPGNPDVIICNLTLRFHTDNHWGAIKLDEKNNKGLISTLLYFKNPGAVESIEPEHYVLFHDNKVRTWKDENDKIPAILKSTLPKDIEKNIDKVIFEKYFDNATASY